MKNKDIEKLLNNVDMQPSPSLKEMVLDKVEKGTALSAMTFIKPSSTAANPAKIISFHVKTTSSAVIGFPSDHFIPCLNLIV